MSNSLETLRILEFSENSIHSGNLREVNKYFWNTEYCLFLLSKFTMLFFQNDMILMMPLHWEMFGNILWKHLLTIWTCSSMKHKTLKNVIWSIVGLLSWAIRASLYWTNWANFTNWDFTNRILLILLIEQTLTKNSNPDLYYNNSIFFW